MHKWQKRLKSYAERRVNKERLRHFHTLFVHIQRGLEWGLLEAV